MKLWEISDSIEAILARQVDPETGEITPETEKALDALEMERDDMAIHIARYIKGEFAEAKAILEQSVALSERATRHSNRAKRLIEYLKTNVPEGYEIEDPTVRIHWRKSKAVAEMWPDEPLTAGHIPREYIKEIVTWKLDKKQAAKDLKEGKKIMGLSLVERNNLKLE